MRPSLFTLRGMRPAQTAKLFWKEIRSEDVFGRAAQLAYYFFLALFPFLICVVASLSVFGVADRGRALLLAMFARFLPGPASELVDQTFQQIIAAGGPLKMSLGIVATLWSASMGMSAVMDTLNAAYRVKETRSLVKQYAVAIGMTFGVGILVVLFTAIGIFGQSLERARFTGAWGVIGSKIAATIVGLALVFLIFAFVYYFAPNVQERQWHWITPGSIAGAAFLILISVGLRVYLHYWSGYSMTYGSLGAVIVLLLTFYLSAIAMLAGGALNALIENAPLAGAAGQQREQRTSEALEQTSETGDRGAGRFKH